MQLVRLAAVAVVVLTGAGATAKAAPVATQAPAITGIALAGQTLKASTGLWSGGRPLRFAYQWQRCGQGGSSCAPIQGATSSSYLLGAADVGATVLVEVTATSATGSANASSAPSATVTAAPPAAATRLPNGGFSIAVTAVVPPDRLLVTSAHLPVGKPAGGVDVQAQVTDSAGYPIAGAQVSLTALPVGLFRQPAAATTTTAGSASFLLQPLPHAWLARSLVAAVLVRADVPGAAAPTAIAGSVLAQLGAASASTPGSPYLPRLSGYDLSYPNCADRPATPPAFAILGVNGGRPFTFNRCLNLEASWFAQGPQAVYLNTGYEPGFRREITPACALASRPHGAALLAYAVGCSEAATSLERTTLLGLSPTIWWLDVEPSNAWSASAGVNISVLRGMLDFLSKLTPTPQVGIYSSSSWWRQITRDWATTAPEWIPSPTTTCPPPFSNGPVWLAQSGSATLDIDISC